MDKIDAQFIEELALILEKIKKSSNEVRKYYEILIKQTLGIK